MWLQPTVLLGRNTQPYSKKVPKFSSHINMHIFQYQYIARFGIMFFWILIVVLGCFSAQHVGCGQRLLYVLVANVCVHQHNRFYLLFCHWLPTMLLETIKSTYTRSSPNFTKGFSFLSLSAESLCSHFFV